MIEEKMIQLYQIADELERAYPEMQAFCWAISAKCMPPRNMD